MTDIEKYRHQIKKDRYESRDLREDKESFYKRGICYILMLSLARTAGHMDLPPVFSNLAHSMFLPSFALYFPKSRAIQFFFFSFPFTDVFLFGSTFRLTFLLALGEGTNGRVVKAGTRITGGTGGVR